MEKTTRAIRHYQKKLMKYERLVNVNGMLQCLTELSTLSIKVVQMELTKLSGIKGESPNTTCHLSPASKALISQWTKTVIVENEYSDKSQHETQLNTSLVSKSMSSCSENFIAVNQEEEKPAKRNESRKYEDANCKRKHRHHKHGNNKRHKLDSSSVDISLRNEGITSESGATFEMALASLNNTSHSNHHDHGVQFKVAQKEATLLTNRLPLSISKKDDSVSVSKSVYPVDMDFTARVKTHRTRVFSGKKSSTTLTCTKVKSLFTSCMLVLENNIDLLDIIGGVPYDILKPVLQKATAEQLFIIEQRNPSLVSSTDELWCFHCKRDFNEKTQPEFESWRDIYLRSKDERATKLMTLTANFHVQQSNTLPVRTTKLAYVDHVATRRLRKSRCPMVPKDSNDDSGGDRQNLEAVPNLVRERSARKNSSKKSKKDKKKRAPLMTKSLNLMNICFPSRRR